MWKHGSAKIYLFLLITFLSFTVINGNSNDTTCGCYMLGTFSNIEEESMCNSKTLQCKCYKNVIGKNCDGCADGFYNILSGRGCSACLCDSYGAFNKTCSALTGQCHCKSGFTGLRCDQCEAFTYKASSAKCEKCNCDPIGSKDLHCDSTGQCPCLEKTEGKQCSQCIGNTYNITRGCIPCSPCYDFVQDSIKNFTKYLNVIEKVLDNIENNLTVHIQDYKHFANEIKLLKAKIQKLRMEIDDASNSLSSEEKLNDLSEAINDFQNVVNKLVQQLNNAFNLKQLKKNIATGGKNLREANGLIGTCESALENATKISKTFSRHNATMTKLAQNAQKTSKEIEDEVEELYNLSLDVNSSCGAACNIVEQFLKDQKKIQNEIKGLQKDILNHKEGLDIRKSYCKGFHERTKTSKEKSSLLLENSNKVKIPSPKNVTKSLNEINDDISAIDKTLEHLNELDNKFRNNRSMLAKNLEELGSKQKDMDDKFFLAKTYESRANKAINDSHNSFESAKISLENLKEYTKIKELAEEALKKVPDIQKKIVAIASNSDEIKKIFRELTEIIKDMEQMKLNISEILKFDEQNRINFSKNVELIEELVKQENENSMKLEKSHAKLKKVREDVKQFKKEQNDFEIDIKRLQEYLLIYSNVPISKKELNAVEKEIETMEEMMEVVAYLRKEKDKLELEVNNVRDIVDALPDDDPNLCESAKSEPKASS